VPRKPRENLQGGVYHVYARGNARHLVYRDDVDRWTYLELLENVVFTNRWRCLAYCLMGNHMHLLLDTPDANLSFGMQRLHGCYAQTFNARHGRSGHVFQGRYGAVRMTSDGQLCATAAYIARNPVEARLCEKPEDWRWSSYRAAIRAPAPAWLDADRLLSYFDTERDAACRSYAQMSTSVAADCLKGV
jgi:putative transposase